MSINLILGGARSGKSIYAEKLAITRGLPVTFIATAQVYDDQLQQRINDNQARRPKEWKLVESPFDLANTIQAEAATGRCVIVDCVTLWLAQCICPDCTPPANMEKKAITWQKEKQSLLDILRTLPGEIILISNEVGMGIVPLGEINRQFQDEQGKLNQAIAQMADRVTFVAAGLPLALKG